MQKVSVALTLCLWGLSSCRPPKSKEAQFTSSPRPNPKKEKSDPTAPPPVEVVLPKETPAPDVDIFESVPLGEALYCDVLVLGGSLSGLAAALNAAFVFKSKKLPNKVCLTEPTDWVGGQISSAGVSAVDFPHHTTGGGKSTPNPQTLGLKSVNMPQYLSAWMNALAPLESGSLTGRGNPGSCWVSHRCFEPGLLLPRIQADLSEVSSNLTVLYQTVVKRVRAKKGLIHGVDLVRRSAHSGTFVPNSASSSWPLRSTQEVLDWYSESESIGYTKKKLTALPPAGKPWIVIDATEWGEALVLSGASYVQGAEPNKEGDFAAIQSPAAERCSQAFIVPVALEKKSIAQTPPRWVTDVTSSFQANRYNSRYKMVPTGSSPDKATFPHIWSYRRLKLASGGTFLQLNNGDVSMQNWQTGNNYGAKGFFLDKKTSAESRLDWKGGIDVEAWSEAEQHSLGWYLFLRSQDSRGLDMALSKALGTNTGLAKIPYLRDGRRSVGVDQFVLTYGGTGLYVGHRFEDEAAAIGTYPADIQPPWDTLCGMPAYLNPPSAEELKPAPYTLPLRALSNISFGNLLVSGKNMAQTFYANSTTRVHPVEFASGAAAGVLATVLSEKGQDFPTAWKNKSDLMSNYTKAAATTRSGAALVPRVWKE